MANILQTFCWFFVLIPSQIKKHQIDKLLLFIEEAGFHSEFEMYGIPHGNRQMENESARCETVLQRACQRMLGKRNFINGSRKAGLLPMTNENFDAGKSFFR